MNVWRRTMHPPGPNESVVVYRVGVWSDSLRSVEGQICRERRLVRREIGREREREKGKEREREREREERERKREKVEKRKR